MGIDLRLTAHEAGVQITVSLDSSNEITSDRAGALW